MFHFELLSSTIAVTLQLSMLWCTKKTKGSKTCYWFSTPKNFGNQTLSLVQLSDLFVWAWFLFWLLNSVGINPWIKFDWNLVQLDMTDYHVLGSFVCLWKRIILDSKLNCNDSYSWFVDHVYTYNISLLISSLPAPSPPSTVMLPPCLVDRNNFLSAYSSVNKQKHHA